MENTIPVLIVSLVVGFYMAWSIGASDVANAMGTSVGSRAVTIKQAIMIAAVFEFVGSFLAGSHVTNTIKQGIIDPFSFTEDPDLFSWGMTGVLFSTGLWLQLASSRGLPVSTTHSLIGSLIGFGLVCHGANSVRWQTIGQIFISWIIAPFLGGFLAWISFLGIRKYVLDSKNPLNLTRKIAPLLLFTVTMVLVFLLLPKQLRWLSIPFSGCCSILFFMTVCSKLSNNKLKNHDETLSCVENIFSWLQIITACFMALAHGSNDVSNAIGPVAAVISVIQNHNIMLSSLVPMWLLGLGGIGIVFGLATYGRNVIETIGHNITEITPTRGFAAEFGAAFTILIGSNFGLPLSTTQVLVGAVIGVGLARGIAGINFIVIRKILGSWLVTIPSTAILSAILTYIIKFLLSK